MIELIIKSLEALWWKGHLSQIYEKVEEINPHIKNNFGKSDPLKKESSFRASIRAYLEKNSSDSEAYNGKNDYFYLVYKKWEWYWWLRNFWINNKEWIGLKTETIQEIKGRLVQSYFRQGLIQKYWKCPITWINITSFLVASHIKPWHLSNSQERINLDNWILLSVHIDNLFDKWEISFNADWFLIFKHNLIKKLLDEKFIITNNKIEIIGEMGIFLEWHRNFHNIPNNNIYNIR